MGGKRITPALRRKIIDAAMAGETHSDLARRYKISRPTVIDVLREATQAGEDLTVAKVAPREALQSDQSRPEPRETEAPIERALKAAGLASNDTPDKTTTEEIPTPGDGEKTIAFLRAHIDLGAGILEAVVNDEDKDLARKCKWTKERESAVEPYAPAMWPVIKSWADALEGNAAVVGFIALGATYVPVVLEFVKRGKERRAKQEEFSRKPQGDANGNAA